MKASIFFYFLLQSNLGKKRSELKHLIKERAKKLEEIKQSIKVIKVSRLRAKNQPVYYCVLSSQNTGWQNTAWLRVLVSVFSAAVGETSFWRCLHSSSYWIKSITSSKITGFLIKKNIFNRITLHICPIILFCNKKTHTKQKKTSRKTNCKENHYHYIHL